MQAEVIDDEKLEVTYVPVPIRANFETLEARVRAMVADYEGATYDLTSEDAIKQAKRDRTYLNGIVREIDERRKAVKREYTKPLSAFEGECKRIMESQRTPLTASRLSSTLPRKREGSARTTAWRRITRRSPTFWHRSCPMSAFTRTHGF